MGPQMPHMESLGYPQGHISRPQLPHLGKKPLNTGASDFTIHPTPALKDWHLCPRSNRLRRQTWDTSISESGLPPQVRGSFIYPKKGNLILSEVNKRQGHVYNPDAFSSIPRQRSSVFVLHYSPKTTI